ncbi:flagellar basal body-associated FliL family protein [Granulicella rosea]|uniref:flagellar basal body-associated FliL family protein n=1 Tax=Granulicella rosea TaxID=474952 RepID=UPI0015951256|nr:flagellar basal body-associated FliL family protein [Granulicella rosea]
MPFLSLALAAVITAVLTLSLAGGGVYWLAHTGRLGSALAADKAPKAAVVEAPPPPKTHSVAFEPLLVNLADEGGTAYLRLSLSLRVLDDEPVKGAKAKEEKPDKGKPVNESEAAVRDVALDVIGRTTAQQLLEVDGKEKLKQQLIAAITKRVPEVKVKDIFFTEFLVQQ